MFKKFLCLFLVLLTGVCLINFKIYNNQPVLKGQNHQFFAQANSSKIFAVEYLTLGGFKAESVEVDKENFNLDNFLKAYGAKLVKTEKIDSGESFYAYSKDIPRVEYVNGQKVNLHVFIGNSAVKIGCPFIYGGF